MNERTHFFIKIYLSHFILERVDVSMVCEKWLERHIYLERGLLLSISSSRSQGVPTLAPPCKLVRDASARLRVPRSTTILCLSKSDRVVLITWSPSGYTSVAPEYPDRLSYLCLLITAWQPVKAPGVTRNEPEIHVICYITYQVQPLRDGVVLGAMTIKGYSIFIKCPKLEPHHQML